MALMISLTLGSIYSFSLEEGYTNFDGIYKVVKIMTYDEYVAEGRDIIADFFTPNEKTQEEANNQVELLQKSKILKLVPPSSTDETDVIYVPSEFIKETPDFNVGRYPTYGLVAYIGITKNTDTLKTIRDGLEQHIRAATGIDPELTFVSTGEQWLTKTQYEEELAKADEQKKRVLNYFSENIRLEKQLAQANSKIQAYEELIIQLNQKLSEAGS